MKIVTETGTLTLEQIQKGIMAITDSEELQLFGRPMPSLTDFKHPINVAKRVPGSKQFESFGRENFSEENGKFINAWSVMGHDVILFRDEEGLAISRIPHAHWRLHDAFQSHILRYGAVTWQAEVTAMERLASHVSDVQYEQYILNGGFIETSKRSGIKYFFRKGKPTLAISASDPENLKCLAALCMHPMGYYDGTSCGCMAPSDEVIAHLIMMRGDEHFYWRRANQHRTWDPRSGV